VVAPTIIGEQSDEPETSSVSVLIVGVSSRSRLSGALN